MVAEALRITGMQTRRRDGRYTIALVVAVTAVVYLAIVAISIRPYGNNLSSLVFVGREDANICPGSLGHHLIVYRDTSYDGLSYYCVADDPFLQRRAYPHVERYLRIGYPLAIWAVSLNQRAWRPAAMVALNIVAVLFIAYVSALLIRLYSLGKSSTWWALTCSINPTLIIGVQHDLGEPMTFALSLLGVYLYLRQRIAWTAVAFIWAMLTRDVAILFLVPIVLAELLGRQFKNVVILICAVVPYLAWEVTLAHVFGHVAAATAQTNFGIPLRGLAEVVKGFMHATSMSHRLGWASILVVAFLICLAILAAIPYAYRRYDVIQGAIVAHGLAALCGAAVIWTGFLSAARVFGGIYPLSTIGFSRYRTRLFSALVGGNMLLTLYTLFHMVLFNPVLSYYVLP